MTETTSGYPKYDQPLYLRSSLSGNLRPTPLDLHLAVRTEDKITRSFNIAGNGAATQQTDRFIVRTVSGQVARQQFIILKGLLDIGALLQGSHQELTIAHKGT